MRILLLDIETSPNTALVWGLFKQNIAITHLIDSSKTLCWAAKWVGEDEIMFSSLSTATRKKMIKQIYNLLNEADVVVHYNGKHFDIPILNVEFISLGLVPPDTYKQVDLLEVARKHFRFTSNKLDYVLKALKIGAKVEHKGVELWIGCMNNDEASWRKMEEYNIGDVVPLERLYERLLPWITNHPNTALYLADIGSPRCTNCGSVQIIRKGIETTKTQRYQRYRCKDCGTSLRGRFTVVTKQERENILVQAQ